MPTNDFQEFVRFIEQSLHSKNAKFSGPVFIKAQGLEDFREVDFIVEDELGPFKLRFAYEATDLGRKMGVGKLEALLHKYTAAGKVENDKFIVVTRKGFTADAMRKAALEGAELVTLSEVMGGGPFRVMTEKSSRICAMQFVPEIPDTCHGAIAIEAQVSFAGHTFGAQDFGKELMKRVIPKNDQSFYHAVIRDAEHSGNGIGHAVLDCKLDPFATVVMGGREFQVTEVKLRYHKEFETSQGTTRLFERTSTVQGASRILHSTAETCAGKVQIAMPLNKPGDKKPPTFLIRLDGKTTKPTADDRKKLRQQRNKEAKKRDSKKGKGKGGK